jgi:hypothetical protein
MRRLVTLLPVVGLVVLVLLAGCEPNLGAGVTVRNETNEPLSFVIDLGGGDTIPDLQDLAPSDWQAIFDYVDLASETSTVGHDGCSTVDVVAYAPDGREVARHGPGLCLGDTWVISGAGPAATDWVETARP